jgi:RNA polymerase sigma factor, sigma-70 family
MRSDLEVPLLTADEESALARTIEAGVLARHLLDCGERPVPASEAELLRLAEDGQKAWERFWLANLRLVHKIAGDQARRSGLPTDDLFQEGCLALAVALQRFDPERGRFATYAAGRIGRHLSQLAAARLGSLGVPVSQAVARRRARSLLVSLSQERGEQLGAAEVAEALSCSLPRARELLSQRSPVALNNFDGFGADSADSDDLDLGILGEQVHRELSRLSPELATIVRLRFGIGRAEPLDTAQLAVHLGVSASTARRRELQALAVLRHRMGSPSTDAVSLAG